MMSDHGDAPALSSKPWRDRSNTMGLLPGKGHEQADALRRVISQLPVPTTGTIEVVSAQGEARNVACEEVFVRQLSRGAFAIRDATDNWVPAPAVAYWMHSGDNLYLAKHLQGNIKFFAELLAAIDVEVRPADLVAIAGKYGLHWTSSDQVTRRLSWLQSLGLAERWGFSRLAVTDEGKQFLAEADVTDVIDAVGGSTADSEEQVDLPEPMPLVSSLLASAEPSDLRKRRIIIGYIPRGRKGAGRPNSSEQQGGIVESARNFVELLGDSASTDEFFQRAADALSQKKSSFTQSMHTFRNMGMIDLISFNRYAPTEAAMSLLQAGSEVDLVRYLHVRYRFMGELLAALDETNSVPNLVKIANDDYDCAQIDNSEIRTRLNFLTDAGLVERIDWTRYRATPSGRALVGQLPLEVGSVADREGVQSTAVEGSSIVAPIAVVISKMRTAANASDLSEDFERAVAEAFELLGFRAEHLGGKGRTDVLVRAELAESERFRVIVDTKASATGVIGDNAIKFDALKDHLKKHRADYGMVVGPDFAPRVKDWAANNKFTLLTVEELVGLVERHQMSPLSLPQLRDLFLHVGSDLSAIEDQYDEVDRKSELVGKIVEILFQEANDEDPMADGYMSLDNLHFALRKELSPRPPRIAVNGCLEFLSSGIVLAVQKDGDRYKIVDAPANIARRLNGLARGLVDISVDDI